MDSLEHTTHNKLCSSRKVTILIPYCLTESERIFDQPLPEEPFPNRRVMLHQRTDSRLLQRTWRRGADSAVHVDPIYLDQTHVMRSERISRRQPADTDQEIDCDDRMRIPGGRLIGS